MHEVSIARNIIEIVNSYLPATNNVSVKSVKVKVGAFTSILPDALRFGYEVLTCGTNLQDSILDILEVSLKVKCNICGSISGGEPSFLYCHSCGSHDVEIIEGTELNVSEIEIFN
ncbi:MAG: hydrogenase nickel insertion protein HypA [Ignavibacteria bacterium]|nr:hydrogenase nickel insertion protein HypA [Ignavibacteria bacterium]